MPSETMNEHEAKLLVVDDNRDNIDILLKVLERIGYDIAIADSGEKALKIAGHVIPDLILMDVMMPGMDGFETCSRMKQNEVTKDIPIIFVTAKTNPESIVQGFRVGGVDYILKPIQEEEVVARVKTHLKIKFLIERQQALIDELTDAMDKVKLLSGFIPICASCKKIRNDEGFWEHIELYIRDHSEAEFSHGICPDCKNKLYPELSKS